MYACGPVVMKQLGIHESLLEDVSNGVQSGAKSQLVPSLLAPLPDNEPGNEVGTSSNEKSTKFDTNDGTYKFLLECARCKGNDRKSVATEANLNSVCVNLMQLHKVQDASVDKCRNLNRRLNEQFRRNPATHKWPREMAFLRGENAENPFNDGKELIPSIPGGTIAGKRTGFPLHLKKLK